MKLLDAIILGEPVGKGRPRVFTIGGKARGVTPAKTRTWEADAAALLAERWAGRPSHAEPVTLLVLAVKSRPGQLMRRKDHDGRIWRPKKPDADNVGKCACDALVIAGVLRDDALVVALAVSSLYAAKGEAPRVELYLSRAPELPPVACGALDP